jgi:polysaccharide biosynthesis transport protein
MGVSEMRDPTPQSQRILEYVEVLVRRPLHFAIPVAVAVVVALVASFVVPKKYTSSTLILLEADKPPLPNLVPKTPSEPISKRLLSIKQEVLSRTRLERVAKEANPYPSMMGRAPLSDVLEQMRNATNINVRGSDAFTIEFVHGDPAKAQAVVSKMASVFIDETTNLRSEQVADVSTFIESQLEDARQEIEAREEALRRFKERNMGPLPEQTAANLATLQRFQAEQQVTEESIRAAAERLRVLEENLGAGGQNASKELATLRGQLADLKSRYTDAHPDVKTLSDRIARMEKEQSETAPKPSLHDPALEAARSEMQALKNRRQDLDSRIAGFQARVEMTPRTEQELATLTRDYQKLKDNYLALFNRKLEATMAEKLDERWKGEHFRILDPAFLPEKASYPKRSMFLLVGIFIGLLAGVAVAIGAEALDQSIKTARELEALMPYPLFATFPELVWPQGEHTAAAGQEEPSSSLVEVPKQEQNRTS